MLLAFLLNELLMAGVKDAMYLFLFTTHKIGLQGAHVMLNLHWTRGGAASNTRGPQILRIMHACRVAL